MYIIRRAADVLILALWGKLLPCAFLATQIDTLRIAAEGIRSSGAIFIACEQRDSSLYFTILRMTASRGRY